MRYMLDTDTLVYVLNARPHHQAVLDRFDREDPPQLCVSAITFAELRFGVEKSREAKATRDQLMRAIDALHRAPFEAGAAAQSGWCAPRWSRPARRSARSLR